MARKRRKTSVGIMFLIMGVLVGYAAAAITRPPSPQGQPLPYSSPSSENGGNGVYEVAEDPGGYSEAEMIFRGYLGIHNNHIAIFQGEPPHGTLQHITGYEVREDLRESLEQGIPFNDTGELLRLLESYTS